MGELKPDGGKYKMDEIIMYPWKNEGSNDKDKT